VNQNGQQYTLTLTLILRFLFSLNSLSHKTTPYHSQPFSVVPVSKPRRFEFSPTTTFLGSKEEAAFGTSEVGGRRNANNSRGTTRNVVVFARPTGRFGTRFAF
jgi:hypothetical protein